jgi:RNA-directed DNA polymerase
MPEQRVVREKHGRHTEVERNVSTIQAQITEIARKHPGEGLTSLNKYLTEDLLRESHRKLRKKAATGVDGKTVDEYGEELEGRLPGLIEEIKTGRYRALPTRRGYIPKPGKDEKRPLGMPAVEDKTVQKAVTTILDPIYEQEFYPFSYGFRKGLGALDATRELHRVLREGWTRWIVEVDIRKFFDTLSHSHLREFLRKRVRDGVILRLIDKWLKAGVLEDGEWQVTDEGTPQGGIVSPLLANIYLHEVLDKWYVQEIRKRLRGRSFLIRYADDFVMGFETEEDARRMMEVLPKRFGRFELSLHMQKTRIVEFKRPDGPESKPGTFDFLGFTHYWGKSRDGRYVHKLKTAKDRLRRSCRAIWEWCRKNLHRSIPEQRRWLNWKLRGHYGYYGVSHNSRALRQYHFQVRRTWRWWLNRRGDKSINWDDYESLLRRHPLSSPRIMHNLYRPCEFSV